MLVVEEAIGWGRGGGRRYLINLYFPLHFCVRLKLFLKKKHTTKSLVGEGGETHNPLQRVQLKLGTGLVSSVSVP